jgi:hypothetical protein
VFCSALSDQASLQQCDRNATTLRNPILLTTSFEGGIAGLFNLLGEITNVALSILLALITIHRVGECYGYCPGSVLEKQFAWSVLNVAVAGNPAERQGAISGLNQIQCIIYRQLFNSVLDETLADDAEEKLVEVVLQRSAKGLIRTPVETWTPVIGSVMALEVNRHLLSQTFIAAYREFQLRWLLEHQRLTI